MKVVRCIIIYACVFIYSFNYQAQITGCGSNVPFYQVNLSGQPSGIWYSPLHQRDGNCCGTQSPDRCTSFEIMLDTAAAMINFNIASGAIPTGAMFYQINCGPQVPVGQPICVSGPGPHYLTFCKPGNNQNTYMVQSIPKPMIPSPQHVRLGCTKKLVVIGLDSASVVWNSIYPGAIGQYNSYLSCTAACMNPTYNPPNVAPPYIDYQVCGIPIAMPCGYVSMCDTVRIFNDNPITASYSPNPAVFCSDGSGITLNAVASGGYGSYNYIWRGQNNIVLGTGNLFHTTVQGNYQLELRDVLYDSLTCPSYSINIPVTQAELPVVNAGVDQTVCFQNSGVLLNGSVINASGAYWSGGNGVFVPNNQTLNATYIATPNEISSGNLTLTLTSFGAATSCTNISDQVNIHFSSPIQIQFSNNLLPCFGSTMDINTNISGGNPPYNFNWNNGSHNATIHVGEGQFCLEVNDQLGCNHQNCLSVISPPEMNFSYSENSVKCFGGTDGSVSLIVNGGTAPYQFSWSNGISNNFISNLSAGTYSVTVFDQMGCNFSHTFQITQPAALNYSISHTNVSCYGSSDAIITATGYGGTPPYFYQWSNGASGSLVNNITAGNYSLELTDANDCSYYDSASVTIVQPDPLVVFNSTVHCPEPGTGVAEINIFPSGGWQNNYQVSLDSGFTFQSFGQTNFLLPVDSVYYITIKDSLGCASMLPVMILIHPEVSIDTVIKPVCFYDDSLTNVEIYISGGSTGTYSVFFNNGISLNSSSNSVAQLSPGAQYEFTATDNSGCVSLPFAFSLNEVFHVNSSVSNINGYEISCYGASSGSIDLSPYGGNSPYQFEWSNNSTSEDLTNLQSGSYSVIVTDQNFCKDTLSFQLTSPQPLSLDSVLFSDYNSYNISCNGLNNGYINALSNSGGVAPYIFQWSNGSSSASIQNLYAGDYTLAISDANNCQQTFTFSLTQPNPISIQVSSISNYNGFQISCNGVNDGYFDVVSNGGSGNYIYLLNNLPANLPVDSLPSGIYSLQVTDQNSCIDSIKIELNEPLQFVISSQLVSDYHGYQISCNGSSDGQINIDVMGGVGQNYHYVWSNGINIEDQYGLQAGIYSVTISDSNGCVLNQSFNLSEPTPLNLSGIITSDFSGYAISCYGSSDGAIDVSATGGAGGYNFIWSNGCLAEDASSLTAGTYSLVISDLNGCSDTLSFFLNSPDSISIQQSIQHILCNGFSNGSIDLNISGGVAPFQCNWSNGSTGNFLQSLSQGVYSVLISDQNNCTRNIAYQINETNPMAVNITLENVKCYGGKDGVINLEVTGGTPDYTYSWSNGSTNQDLLNLETGNYFVTITDVNGCNLSDTVLISEPDALYLFLNPLTYPNGYQLSSPNSNDGLINTFISGGLSPYTFQWSNGSSSQNLDNLSYGTYTLQVTDSNGCVKISSLNIDSPGQLELPTGISPNGDGKNDQFVIHGLESYPNNTLLIFNRWGNLVYDRSSYLNDWQGTTNKGEYLPDGTYFVILEIHSPNIQFNGYVDIRK